MAMMIPYIALMFVLVNWKLCITAATILAIMVAWKSVTSRSMDGQLRLIGLGFAAFVLGVSYLIFRHTY